MEGIIWKRFPGMADGRGDPGGPTGGAGAGTHQPPDYSRFGTHFLREQWIPGAGTAYTAYELPDDLLRAPTALEVQLFEPGLYLPEAPTTPTRLSSQLGRLHARIFWSVGNSGPMRVDCDWIGSVPLVAHKQLTVQVVADLFSAASSLPSNWDSGFSFSEDTGSSNPGAGFIHFDVALPGEGDPITSPPSVAYVSRQSLSAEDAVDFTVAQTNEQIRFTLTWGVSASLGFHVASIVEHAAYLELHLAGLTGIDPTMPEALADDDPVTVTLSWEDSPPQTRIDVAVAVVLGSRPSAAPPTYTFPTTALAADASASFPVPAFARKLRCAIKWGEADGSSADAALGQYFFAFNSRGFGALAWIDAASAREALFGDGLPVPPGTHAVTISNRSPDQLDVTPSFLLGL